RDLRILRKARRYPAAATQPVACRRCERQTQGGVSGVRQLDGEVQRVVTLSQEHENLAADLDGAVAPGKVFDGFGITKRELAQLLNGSAELAHRLPGPKPSSRPHLTGLFCGASHGFRAPTGQLHLFHSFYLYIWNIIFSDSIHIMCHDPDNRLEGGTWMASQAMRPTNAMQSTTVGSPAAGTASRTARIEQPTTER